jgi:hypothetical protein
LKYYVKRDPTPHDNLKASAIAGGVAGTCGGMLRTLPKAPWVATGSLTVFTGGPRNIIPAAIMFSLFGAAGQSYLNSRARRAANTLPKSPDELGFWAKYSPLKQLSDRDYEKILEERLLRIDADIAVIDDSIRELREAESRIKARAAKRQSGGLPSSDNA